MKGMTMSIWKDNSIGECSNGGISKWVNRVTVVCIPEVFRANISEPNERAPAVVIKKRGSYVYAEPLESPKEGNVGWMMGGSCISTSDSRWSEYLDAEFGFPGRFIPLHDRQETMEEYEALSR